MLGLGSAVPDIVVDFSTVPGDRFLSSEARLKRRVDDALAEAMDKLLEDRGVTNLTSGGQVKIAVELDEPTFHFDRDSGNPTFVITGNPAFVRGDTIPKPKGGTGGQGPGGGAGTGEWHDDFVFEVNEDEMLDHLLKGLELPDMQDRVLVRTSVVTIERAGFQLEGPAAQLELVRSASNAIGRRKALHRPRRREVLALEEELAALRAQPEGSPGREEAIEEVTRAIAKMKRKRGVVPYMDASDQRFRRREAFPKPIAAAVVFCIMDRSGSMTQHRKDLAKRFFWLLRHFLRREYQKVDVVFISHTDTAKEVPEKDFFFGTETGGTVVSTALEKMLEIQKTRYPLSSWNVYVCQAGDGDTGWNLYGQDDALHSASLLEQHILPIVQYYAYLETREHNGRSSDAHDSQLWEAYGVIGGRKNFKMVHASEPGQIFPVFKELFRAKGTTVRR